MPFGGITHHAPNIEEGEVQGTTRGCARAATSETRRTMAKLGPTARCEAPSKLEGHGIIVGAGHD